MISWHDIPSAVIAGDGQATHRAELPARFIAAINRAATGGGQAGSDAYLQGWRRTVRSCTPDVVAEVEAEIRDIDERIDDTELAWMIQQHRATRRSPARDDALQVT
ncbi:MAG: virulence factor [Ornithinimicrobium sp.]